MMCSNRCSYAKRTVPSFWVMVNGPVDRQKEANSQQPITCGCGSVYGCGCGNFSQIDISSSLFNRCFGFFFFVSICQL